ncbi:MAG: hypothetical protein RQ990_02755 [Candidatus Hydrothermia bacterium]|jgi:hypothetical protein|nr:hypothetical protein [Candidatus Hydrothermia bacterium]
MKLDIELLVELIKRGKNQYIINKETGQVFEISNKILDAVEDDYYEHLTSEEMECANVLKEMWEGSNKYEFIPKISEGDLINIITEIIESLDKEDNLREILMEIVSTGGIQKKINYLIVNYKGFYEIYDKFLTDYLKRKIKNWALTLGFEILEPEE